MKFSIYLIPLLLLPAQALAGNSCGFIYSGAQSAGNVYAAKAVAVKQVHAKPVSYQHDYQHVQQILVPIVQPAYQVGAVYQQHAEVTKALRTDPEYAEFQKFKEYKHYQELKAKYEPEAPTGQPTTRPTVGSALSKHCAACHGSALNEPKDGLYYDANTPLKSKHVTAALRVLKGENVPPAMQGLVNSLSAEDKGALAEELLALDTGE